MTLAGVMTNDGMTMGADENLTIGSDTLTFASGTSDFELSDDLTISDTTPHVRLTDTDGDDFEIYADANELLLTNVTDGKVHLYIRSNDTIAIPQVPSCSSLQTSGTGVISCQTVTAPSYATLNLLPYQAV